MFTIVSDQVEQSELIDIVTAVELPKNGKIELSTTQHVAGGTESAIVASIITGGVSVLVSLINGLFLLWSIKKRSKDRTSDHTTHTVVVVTTSGRKFRISREEHAIKETELEDDDVAEIRLEWEEPNSADAE